MSKLSREVKIVVEAMKLAKDELAEMHPEELEELREKYEAHPELAEQMDEEAMQFYLKTAAKLLEEDGSG